MRNLCLHYQKYHCNNLGGHKKQKGIVSASFAVTNVNVHESPIRRMLEMVRMVL